MARHGRPDKRNPLHLDIADALAFAASIHVRPPLRDYYRIPLPAYLDVGTMAAAYSKAYWESRCRSTEDSMQRDCAQVLGWLLHAYDLYGLCFEDVLWRVNLFTAEQLVCATEDSRLPEVQRDRMFLSQLMQAAPPALCAVMAERAIQIGQLLRPCCRRRLGVDAKTLVRWCAVTTEVLVTLDHAFLRCGQRQVGDTIERTIISLRQDVATLRASVI